MRVLVVGSGKLATEVLGMRLSPDYQVLPWGSNESALKSIVVHAGSGRELPEVLEYCRQTNSTLIELSTGTSLCSVPYGFPIVVCPNVNVLMLKFMGMLRASGHLFRDCGISLTESHQATKTSVPGTAVSIAGYLNLSPKSIRSVRDVNEQMEEFRVPHENLSRHAIHRIQIREGDCTLQFESRVIGTSPYAQGTAQIVQAVGRRQLESRYFSVMDLIDARWI